MKSKFAVAIEMALIRHQKKKIWLAQELGISRQMVSRMLNGKTEITTTRLDEIAQILEIKTSELIAMAE